MGLRDSVNRFAIFTQPPYSFTACHIIILTILLQVCLPQEARLFCNRVLLRTTGLQVNI